MLFFPPKKLGKNKGAQNKHAPIIFFLFEWYLRFNFYVVIWWKSLNSIVLYVHFFIALSSFFIYEILQVKYNKNILSYNCSIHIEILNSIIKLQLNNHKSVKKNSFKYILRLWRENLVEFAQRFPWQHFRHKIQNGFPWIFPPKFM